MQFNIDYDYKINSFAFQIYNLINLNKSIEKSKATDFIFLNQIFFCFFLLYKNYLIEFQKLWIIIIYIHK